MDANELVATVRSLLRTRHAEVQVRAAAREWTTAFDLISDPVCLTRDGDHIVRCNAAFAQLLGWPYPEIIGRRLRELVPELARAADDPAAGSAIRLGQRHFRLSVDLGEDADGAATRAWVLGDITEQQQHEEALQRSQDQAQARLGEIEAVYSSAPVGLCVLDVDLRYQRLNERMAEMIGYPVEALLGRTVRETTTPALADEVEPKLRQLLATGEPVRGLEVRGVTDAQPGVERVWVATWLPLRDADGRVAGINVAAEEVTENRRLQEKLMEAHRLEAVGRLAGGVAHETNNQMTVVLGCAGFVLRHPTLPAAVRTDIEQIRQAAERTARITAQLLAYGRRQHLQPEVVDLDTVIERLRPFLARALGDRCTLSVRPGSLGQRVRADVGQIEQMLLNLTLNARDAMPDGGELTILTNPFTVPANTVLPSQDDEIHSGDYVCLAVADTGHGMTPSTLQRAFEPFFTTKGPGKGTGLGLSMVYGLVKQSGGYIRAESDAGHGTRIEVVLPRVDSPAPTGVEPTATGPAALSAHVLVVEDDPLVRTVVARELDHPGLSGSGGAGWRGGPRAPGAHRGAVRPAHHRPGDAADRRPRAGRTGGQAPSRPSGPVHVGSSGRGYPAGAGRVRPALPAEAVHGRGAAEPPGGDPRPSPMSRPGAAGATPRGGRRSRARPGGASAGRRRGTGSSSRERTRSETPPSGRPC